MPIHLQSPWYHVAGAALCALALAYWGWRDRRRHGMSGSIAVRWLLASSIAILWMPSLLLNRIRLDDEGMHWNAGYWWAKQEGRILFSEIDTIRVHREKQHLIKNNSEMVTVWMVTRKDGRVERHEVFDLWMEHYVRIRERFESEGIVVADAP